ncbi:MAG: beta-lactamase family protein [Roseivirga sp.]|nr:beta-lactamase family protein [Roseivirga sp.]
MNIKRFTLYLNITRPSYVFFLALGFLLTVGLAPQAMAQAQKNFRSNGKKVNVRRFNKEVDKMMNEMGVPGLSLAIIENDQIVFRNGYGMKRLGEAKDASQATNFAYGYSVKHLDIDKPVDAATVFNGASLSKTFLAFVALQLAEEELLDLDKPMYQYMAYSRLEHDERYKQITARMALSHSSGMENWQHQNDSKKLEIIHNPGEAFLYSGEGYNFLALVIKQILQESYSVYARERVIEKLELKNSYLNFNRGENPIPLEKQVPMNFVAAHPMGGGQYIIRNIRVQPAYANHFNAEDYAKLVLGMFNTKNLSNKRIKEILEPKVKIGWSKVHYGPGFKLIFSKGDTIICHGGDNPGYKNFMFYSPVKKRGFVMLTNSDRGKSMSARLNTLTTELEIEGFLAAEHDLSTYLQYPDPAFNLLKAFDEKGATEMYAAMESGIAKGKITARSMNGLAMFFLWYGDRDIGFKILENAKATFPKSALTYCLLGDYYLDNGDYKLALEQYHKSKALNFSYWDLEEKIRKCEKGISQIE